MLSLKSTESTLIAWTSPPQFRQPAWMSSRGRPMLLLLQPGRSCIFVITATRASGVAVGAVVMPNLPVSSNARGCAWWAFARSLLITRILGLTISTFGCLWSAPSTTTTGIRLSPWTQGPCPLSFGALPYPFLHRLMVPAPMPALTSASAWMILCLLMWIRPSRTKFSLSTMRKPKSSRAASSMQMDWFRSSTAY